MSVAPIQSVTRGAPGQFSAAALRHASPAEQRAAVAQQFEAVLVRQLLGKTMNSMLGGEGAGAAGGVYGDMLADSISQQLTAGRGMGLGRFIEQQLTPKAPAGPKADQAAVPNPVAGSVRPLPIRSLVP